MTTRTLLLAATLLAAGAGAAFAQAPGQGSAAAPAAGPAVFNPDQLPTIQGKVAQFSLTPRGDVDGVILQDGTQVHMPPHFGPLLAQAVKPGDAVTVHGLRAEARPVVQAGSITDDATGHSVVDNGPPGGPPGAAGDRQHLDVSGKVREALYGPRGEINGALLEDGTQVHLPPGEAARLASLLQPGQMLQAQGYGVAGALGRSLAAEQIGAPGGQMTRIAAGHPHPHGGPGGRHGPHGHGPGFDRPDAPSAG